MNSMNVFYTRESLHKAINAQKSLGRSIGFVPTMGALHEGHLELVKNAIKQVDKVVVSIFVNPTQFNNENDLELYPRMLNDDVNLLNSIGDVFVFAPNYSEVYPDNDHFEPLDLEGIDMVLEGKFRPGHFHGVVHVVRNLFQIVQPDKAFFGLKDFQQVAIIRLMVRKLEFNIQIVCCKTSRDLNGLALSSRNLRLTDSQKKDALIIYRTLVYLTEIKDQNTPEVARLMAIDFFNKGNLKLEYLEIVNGTTLKPLKDEWGSDATCCIAAFCGEVRLIDNIQF